MMAPLLQRVLGLPFPLGATHPDQGGLDCGGLVAWMLGERLVQVSNYGQRSPIRTDAGAFEVMWVATDLEAKPHGWMDVMQAWDILVSEDPEVYAPLHTQAPAVDIWRDVAMAISPDLCVGASLDQGVCILHKEFIQQRWGAQILCLLRPRLDGGGKL